MNPVLKLLMENSRLAPAQMAQVLGLSETEVTRQLDELKAQGIFLGWRPVLNLAKEETGVVRAVIEVKIRPERGGGGEGAALDPLRVCHLRVSGAARRTDLYQGANLRGRFWH